MIFFIIFMLPEILFAERTQTVGFRPVLNAFRVKYVLTEEISYSISAFIECIEAYRTFIIAAPRINLKVKRILKEPFSIGVSYFLRREIHSRY